MRRQFAFISALFFIFLLQARNFVYDGINYEITSIVSPYSVAVTSGLVYSGDIVVPETVSRNDTVFSVTSINSNAFNGSNELSTLSIPNSVVLIKSQAFFNCTGLSAVVIGDSTNTGAKTSMNIQPTAFDGCSGLTSLSLYVPIISYNNPFRNLSTLKTLAIGNSVNSIDNTIFSSLEGLTKVILGCYELTPVTISVSVGAFSNSDNLEKLILNCNLQIGSYYSGNVSPFSKISTLTINDKVTSLGNYAFFGCNNIQKVAVSNGITTMGNYAFADCSNLNEITLGKSVNQLGSGLFSGCNALLNIFTNDLNTIYKSNEGVLFKKDQQTLIQYPLGRIGEYVIPEQVKTIEKEAFAGCSGLSTIKISQTTTLISASAFANCQALKYVYIGHVNSISTEKISISSNAFNGCTNFSNLTYYKEVSFASSDDSPFKNIISIDTVYIGNAVTTIPNLTFLGCSGLKFVRIGVINNQNINPIMVSASAFSGCQNFTKLELNRSFNISGYDSPFTTITNLSVGEGVTLIVQNAFYNCTKLTTVTLPSSLKIIDNQAFYYCTQLSTITIPEIINLGSFAFSNCSSLKSIILPNSISIIQSYTFNECTALENVQLGNLVTHINEYAFSNCRKLNNIDIPHSVQNIGNYAFSGCSSIPTVNLGSSLQNLGTYSFSRCSSVLSIQFPSTLSNIPDYAFENCSGLKDLHIPSTIKTLSSNAFANCTNIATITIGDVENPGTPLLCTLFPFTNCTAVKTLILNKDIINDEYSSPFMTLTSLENVIFSNRVSRINTFAFYGCTKIKKLIIPNSVISISDAAFQGCTLLSEIKLPDFIRIIPNQLFYGCTNLKSINIPTNVESIGSYAFYNCSTLNAINIPAINEIIGPMAFSGCVGLTEISSASLVPSPIGYSGFGNINKSICNLYIPTSTKTQYQSAVQWADFGNIIEKEFNSPTINSDTITHVMKTVNLSAGELSSALSTSDLKSILKLSIIGEINSSDLNTIRSLTSLIFLDMSQVVFESNTISASAFSGMNNLAFIDLPNTVTSIGTRAFENCGNLIKIKLPENLTIIERQTFANCDRLMSIELPSILTIIKGSSFYDCGRLFHFKLPTSLTTIEDNVFAKCSGLRNVLLPNSISTIGEFAFAGCYSLQDITIPSSISSINWALFKDCISLTSVTFPSTIKTIGSEVFVNCRKLKSIYMYANQPPTFLYYTTLYDLNRNPCTLYVPKGCIDIYRKSEVWNEIFNIVEMINTDVRSDKAQAIVLYPKFVTDGFQIKGINNTALLSVFSLNGVVMMTKKIIENEYISINALPKGIYVIKIQNNDNFFEHKIMKQ